VGYGKEHRGSIVVYKRMSQQESKLTVHKMSVALMAAILVFGGCGSDEPDLPVPARFEKIPDGDGQTATAGARLATPLSVLVTASDGSAVPREKVVWSVTEGDGAVLSDSATVTDGKGIAQVYLTLGPTAGPHSVESALARKRDGVVTFTATASRPPVITAVNPSTFTGGDIVTLSGFGLWDSTAVRIGEKLAALHAVSPTGQGMQVIVPRCLFPGTVNVTVGVGNVKSDTLSGTFTASTEPLRLSPGEYVSLDPEAMDGCATFEDATGDSTEYLLAPQSVTGSPGLTLAYRLRGDSGAAPIPLAESQPTERPLSLRFDDFLRQQEADLAALSRDPMEQGDPQLVGIELNVVVGDRRTFRVCDKITCNTIADFAQVTGEARYAGTHAIIYEDIDAPSDGLSQHDFDQLGALFDVDLYDVATRAFGSESDIDRNGRVLILMSPIVNGLTERSECSDSFITGFFFPLDIDPKFQNDSRSNHAEIFYSIVPDPQGTVTCDHSVDRVKRVVPVTFAHELQHMVNFHQHVIVRAGNSEQTWLNEAMSHMAEELAALHFEALGESERFTAFALGDLLNAFLYLSDTEAHYPLYTSGTGTLEERGASWLFLRWVSDQLGEGVLRRLSETSLVGAENLAAATGESLDGLLADWFLANYVSDHPNLSSVPDRLRYSTWDFRSTYADLHAQDPSLFDRPFPVDPIVFSGGSFDVSGLLGSGSGAYYRVIQMAGQRGFTVELVDDVGDPLSGPAKPRLNVIRIR
jgi:hypothetical protein